MKTELERLKKLEDLVSDLLSHFPEREIYMLEESDVITDRSHYRGRVLDFDKPEDLFHMVLFELLHATEKTKFELAKAYNIE